MFVELTNFETNQKTPRVYCANIINFILNFIFLSYLDTTFDHFSVDRKTDKHMLVDLTNFETNQKMP